MAQTTINIRLEETDKILFEEICGQLGMTMSTAFHIFAKAFIHQGGFPFELRLDPNPETIEAIEDVHRKRSLSGPYKSRDALRDALDA